jgi:hypothetical protein
VQGDSNSPQQHAWSPPMLQRSDVAILRSCP